MRASIIVPVYNHERFLPECLMSIYDQAWDDLELVVIDDASTDGSFAVAKRFCETPWIKSRFSRLALDKNSINRGAAGTINKAIAKATGELLMIVNSDDRYRPQRVAACADAISNGFRFVFSAIRCIDETGQYCLSNEAAHFERTVAEIARYPSISLALLEKNRAISTGNICITRELAEHVGPFRPLRYCHDWDFILTAILETEPFWIDAPLYEYRLHGSNTFRALADVAEADTKACFQRFFQGIDRQLVNNEKLRAMIEAPGLWEPLVRRAGPVIESEWLSVKSGLNHRPVVLASENGEPAAQPDRARAADISATEVNRDMVHSRVADGLFLVHAEGQVYADGWIGETASFRLRSGPEVDRAIADIWLPQYFEPRVALFTFEAGTEPVRETVVALRPGETIPISFKLDRATRSFTIGIRCPDAVPIDTDRRTLGLVIIRFRTGCVVGPEAAEAYPAALAAE